jgi:hypothetical protein
MIHNSLYKQQKSLFIKQHQLKTSTTMPSAPTKSSLKTPAKKYCPEDGKVLNWSVVWPEARELEVLVMGGLLDGMTAAAVMEK